MDLNRTLRRASAVVASLAAGGLLTLANPAQASSGSLDSDHDGMPNRWELRHGLNPNRPNANGDKDHDGLRNLGEFRHGTDPQEADADTDGDGTDDGAEDEDGDGIDNAADDDDQGENCDDQGEDGRVLATYVVR